MIDLGESVGDGVNLSFSEAVYMLQYKERHLKIKNNPHVVPKQAASQKLESCAADCENRVDSPPLKRTLPPGVRYFLWETGIDQACWFQQPIKSHILKDARKPNKETWNKTNTHDFNI